MVVAFSHISEVSAPASNALTMGWQPSACTEMNLGCLPSIHPSSNSSLNPLYMPMIPVPPPVGYITASGIFQPSCWTISRPIDFLPSARYGSLRVERSKNPNSLATATASRPASLIRPSTRFNSDPATNVSFLLASGASWGMNTLVSIPALAP